MAATKAKAQLGLDVVLFVVAADPWQKRGTRPLSPAEVRMEMVEALIASHEGLEASGMEIARGGPSYSVDTARRLCEEARAAGEDLELYLIVGADLAGQLETWHEPEELAALVTVAIVERDGEPEVPLHPRWRSVKVTGGTIDASSTMLRSALAEGLAVDALTDPGVIRIVEAHDLYHWAR